MNTMLRFNFFVLFFCFLFCCFFAKGKSGNMVFIPSGEYTPLFRFGDDFSEDKVFVKSFYIDVYPVTNLDFSIFILLNPDWSIKNICDIFSDRGYLTHWDCEISSNMSNYPVINVSWFSANAYCEFIGGRLPTIDEWEFTASTKKYYSGSEVDGNLQDILNWYVNFQKELTSIKFMSSNSFGVFGMHGVIWEWVQDFNSVILLNSDAEGGGLEEVLYCGATAVNAIDPADYVAFMRFSFRNNLEADYTMSSLGFRCVKNI